LSYASIISSNIPSLIKFYTVQIPSTTELNGLISKNIFCQALFSFNSRKTFIHLHQRYLQKKYISPYLFLSMH